MDRDRELAVTEFSRDVAVDASAGTGKTATLVARVVNLFLRDPEPAAEDVLLLTFTEKAAGEMKARIVEGWETLLAACRAGGTVGEVRAAACAWNPLVRIPEDPDPSPERLAERVERLVEGIGRLSVTTFHAFCRRVLLSFPAEAGVDPRFTVLDEGEAADAWDAGFGAFLREEFGTAKTDPRWDLLLSRGPGPESLFGMLRTLCLSQRDLLLRGELDFGSPADLMDAVREACAPHVDWFRAFVGGIAAGPEHEMTDVLRGALAVLEAAWGAVAAGDFEAAEARAAEGARTFAFRADRTKSRKLFPVPPGSTLRESRDALREMFEAFAGAREGDAAARFLVDRASAALAHYIRAKGEALDFMDLLLRANDLFERRPDVAARLTRRFRHVFVDEFQDTDPLQAAMLGILAGNGPPGRLFVVGDPKQSIYGFRRADIQVYKRFRDGMLERGGLPVTLVRNFRSRPDLVAGVNGIFGEVLSGREDFSPAYAPVRAHRSDAGPDPAVTWFRLAEEVPEEEFLCALLRRIVGTVRVGGTGGAPGRAASFRDVAVLYRSDAGGELLSSYVEAMVRAGIPHVVPPRRGFFTRQEVQDLRLVLRAVDAPADRAARYAALKTIFFGLADDEIVAGGEAATASPRCAEALGTLSRLAARRGRAVLPDLLSALYEETGIAYVVARLPEGERILSNLRKAHRMAREFEARGGSVSGFAAELRRWAKQDRGESEFASFDEGEDAVRISSIHAAKGLEFPVVVLAGISRGGRKGVAGLRTDRVRGLSAVIFPGVRSYSAYRRVPLGGVPVSFEAWEREKLRAEELRLLYVAATRARDRLFLLEGGRGQPSELLLALRGALAGTDDGGESPCPVTGLPGRRKLFPVRPADRGAPSGRPGGDPGNGALLLVDGTSLPAGEAAPRGRAAPPPLSLPADVPPDDGEAESSLPPIVPLRVFLEAEEARSFGEKVHKALEAYPPGTAAWPPPGSLPPAAGFAPEEEARFRAIARTIDGSDFLRRLRETEHVGTEVPLLSFAGGVSREERADLVVRSPGSPGPHAYWVVDYKTGLREPATEEAHRRQVAGYVTVLGTAWAAPVRGFLWYVETGEVVEISP